MLLMITPVGHVAMEQVRRNYRVSSSDKFEAVYFHITDYFIYPRINNETDRVG
jgi:hypothetical protein